MDTVWVRGMDKTGFWPVWYRAECKLFMVPATQRMAAIVRDYRANKYLAVDVNTGLPVSHKTFFTQKETMQNAKEYSKDMMDMAIKDGNLNWMLNRFAEEEYVREQAELEWTEDMINNILPLSKKGCMEWKMITLGR